MKYTAAQHEAIVTTGKHICVRAGAGSGKTRVLIDRIIHLIETDQAKLGEIVAITFTRKAAAEMRERLRTECQKRVSAEDSRVASKWIDSLHEIDTARITTIDSFCSGLLRDYGLWAQDDPEFAMMNESEAITVPRQIAEQELSRLADVDDPAAAELIHAFGMRGAMDTVMEVLGRPLRRQRLAEALAVDEEELIVGWWAIVMEDICDRAPDALAVQGASGNPENQRERFCEGLIDCARQAERGAVDEKWWGAIAALGAYKFNTGPKKNKDADEIEFGRLKEFTDATRKFLSAVSDDRSEPGRYQATAALTRALAHVVGAVQAAYQEHKRTQGLKDFGDLLGQSVELIVSKPEIRDRIARSMRHLLIDEFQDTNDAQWSLARGLMKTDEQDGPELFIVGDAKQSIYRFRNAQVQVFQRAQEQVDHLIELNTNFRSTPNVMDGINHYFEQSMSLEAVADRWVPLETDKDSEEAPGVAVLLSEFAEGDNAPIQRQKEAGTIASLVERLVSTDESIHYGDIAILFRKKGSLYLYENALRRAGIPFETFGGKQFFFRQEIADLINALHVVHDPWNEHALLGFLRGPMVALDDNSILHLGWRRGLAESVYGEREVPDTVQQQRLAEARVWLQELQAHASDSAANVIQRLIELSRFESVLYTLPHGPQRVNNVRKMLDIAREMSRNGRSHLYQFIRYVEEQTTHNVIEEDAPHYGERTDAVSLMTVHASKGLEFPVVILADSSAQAGSGNMNSNVASHDGSGIAVVPPKHGDKTRHALAELMKARNTVEERAEDARVLYVAMTRAERRLILSGSVRAQEDNGVVQYGPFRKGSVLASIDSVYGVLDGANAGATRMGPDARIELMLGSTLDSSRPKPKKQDAHSALSEPVADRYRPFQAESSVPASLSVTQWLNEQFPGPEVMEGFDVATHTAMMRGTMTHVYLEAWEFTGPPPEVNEFLAVHFPALAQDGRWCEYLQEIAETLKVSELLSVLTENGPIRRELPFTVMEDERWISGTIDVLTDSGVVIDYKTGAHRASSMARYEAQLQLYARAVATLTGTAPHTGWVYFVESGEMESVALG